MILPSQNRFRALQRSFVNSEKFLMTVSLKPDSHEGKQLFPIYQVLVI